MIVIVHSLNTANPAVLYLDGWNGRRHVLGSSLVCKGTCKCCYCEYEECAFWIGVRDYMIVGDIAVHC